MSSWFSSCFLLVVLLSCMGLCILGYVLGGRTCTSVLVHDYRFYECSLTGIGSPSASPVFRIGGMLRALVLCAGRKGMLAGFPCKYADLKVCWVVPDGMRSGLETS
jgi:hypothetical protein